MKIPAELRGFQIRVIKAVSRARSVAFVLDYPPDDERSSHGLVFTRYQLVDVYEVRVDCGHAVTISSASLYPERLTEGERFPCLACGPGNSLEIVT